MGKIHPLKTQNGRLVVTANLGKYINTLCVFARAPSPQQNSGNLGNFS